MRTETIVVGQLDTNCHIIIDDITEAAVIVDPGDEPEIICSLIDRHGLRPAYIIFTHAHYDHVCAARELKDRYHAQIAMHEAELETYSRTQKQCLSWGFEAEDFPCPDILLKDMDELQAGSLCLRIIHTPGHSPGSICLHVDRTLLTGDTLFCGSAGRTDLPGGNTGQLILSLKRLSQFDPGTRVLCGHDEETTIGDELAYNPFMNSL